MEDEKKQRDTSRYKHAKIYKLVSDETDDVYYGSSCNALRVRLGQHKKRYRSYLNGKDSYLTSYEIVKFDTCQIVLVEDFPCERKEQLLARERWYIENNQCINKNHPGRSPKEYFEDYKDRIQEYQKQYRNQNKLEMKEYSKQYYEQNRARIQEINKTLFECPCGRTYRRGDKARHERSNKHQAYIGSLSTDE